MNTIGTLKSHYPSYSVMDRVERWDSHTKEIIRKRLGPFSEAQFLSAKESSLLAQIAKHIIYDDRNEIIAWIIHHFDEKLSSKTGEDQRQLGLKPQNKLIRDGLMAIDHAAEIAYHRGFAELSEQQQFELISSLQKNQAAQSPDWQGTPQKKLFENLVKHIVEAYYSHPVIWSEIGYGGPVYPDVYVRVELGLTDPWEAKRVGE